MPRKTKKMGLEALILIVLLIISGILVLWIAKQAREVEMIPLTHGSMTDREAFAYFQAQILPIIQGASSDPLPGIREIIGSLGDIEAEGKVEVGIAPTYRDGSLAATYPAAEGNLIWITFAGPRLQDYQEELTDVEFKDQVILVICHETLHLLYDPVFTEGLYRQKLAKGAIDEARLKGEALVWALTIERVIRPMISAGRKVRPENREVSQVYKELGNNPLSLEWLNWVQKHRFASEQAILEHRLQAVLLIKIILNLSLIS